MKAAGHGGGGGVNLEMDFFLDFDEAFCLNLFECDWVKERDDGDCADWFFGYLYAGNLNVTI